jgi:hypothetical protein
LYQECLKHLCVATDGIGYGDTEGNRRRKTTRSDDMTTILNDTIDAGDVIELIRNGDVISALVLLAADEAVILDACDGSTPFVVKRDELVEYRKFVPTF